MAQCGVREHRAREPRQNGRSTCIRREERSERVSVRRRSSRALEIGNERSKVRWPVHACAGRGIERFGRCGCEVGEM